VSPDARTLVYGGADAIVRVWDLQGAFNVSDMMKYVYH
jgi:WD40 repeat protein